MHVKSLRDSRFTSFTERPYFHCKANACFVISLRVFFSGKRTFFFFEVELGHQSVPHMGLSVRSVSQRGERGGESLVGKENAVAAQ